MIKKTKQIFQKYSCIILFVVLTRRVRVANELYSKSDADLLEAGRTFWSNLNGNSLFPSPLPSLLSIQTILDDFEALILAAATGGPEETTLKDAKREEVMNTLSSLAAYVEPIANDPANAGIGAVAVIESAGMRPQTFSPRQKQMWAVIRGMLPCTLFLTAAALKRGTHEWQYTLTPTDSASWVSAPSTTKASTIISGLTSGTFVYCRHRTVTKSGTSAWEGHDPVVVG